MWRGNIFVLVDQILNMTLIGSFFIPLTEPYNYFGRRGRKEPEALAAASLKRLFVDNQPYLVGGYCQNGLSSNTLPSIRVIGSKFSFSLHRDAPNILSMADKYKHMKETFRKRLAFGKRISLLIHSYELMILLLRSIAWYLRQLVWPMS